MKTEVLEDLRKAIKEYDSELAASLAKKIVEEKLDLTKAMDAMTEVVREVGDAFGKGRLWLPDLVGAGEAMSSAMKILEEELKKRGESRQGLGIVVIGTVQGDIHSIGKDMLVTLFVVEDFVVHDLGVDVKAEAFVEAVRFNADVLCMSSLLTTSAPEQKKVIEALKKEGLRDKVKILVGGGAITQEFANRIGADGYDPTALGGVRLARKLLGKIRKGKC